ncbi:MAG: PIN domain-containing protein [Candidatus Nanohaloarchaea archaeon]
MIVDTSFLIDLLTREESAMEKAKEMEDENIGYSVPSPALYEAWMGIRRGEVSGREEEELLEIIESQPVSKLGKEESEEAGKIQGELIDEGERIGHMDALIAGIARSKGRKILTSDEDFDKVEGLVVRDY